MFNKLLELTQFGVQSLLRYKLRSLLTMLGIIFGIAAVISMMAVGAGAEQEVLRQIQTLGISNIIVNSVKPPQDKNSSSSSMMIDYGVKFQDADLIRETLGPRVEMLEVHGVQRNVWLGSLKVESRVKGIDTGKQHLLHLNLVRGRLLNPIDQKERRRVCLVTRSLLLELNYLGDPLQLQLKIDNIYFQVVGVLDQPEFAGYSSSALKTSERAPEIYVPFDTSLRRFGVYSFIYRTGSMEFTKQELDQIVIQVPELDEIFSVARLVRTILERTHTQQDYELIIPLELLRQREQTQQVFNIVMVIVASISLLVGGIGIVNIMLATITERTKEIGIRRALGARKRDISLQFLVETVVLTSIGGILGCAFGVGGSYLLQVYSGWPVKVSIFIILLSMAISCGVGIAFGIYPARRAANMDPIAALRYE